MSNISYFYYIMTYLYISNINIYIAFQNTWLPQYGNDIKLKQETYMIEKKDIKVNLTRDLLSEADRFQEILQEAFNWMVLIAPFPTEQTVPMISFIGFRKIFLNGKLLNLLPESMEINYRTIDTGYYYYLFIN